jgi:hypothetical protein
VETRKGWNESCRLPAPKTNFLKPKEEARVSTNIVEIRAGSWRLQKHSKLRISVSVCRTLRRFLLPPLKFVCWARRGSLLFHPSISLSRRPSFRLGGPCAQASCEIQIMEIHSPHRHPIREQRPHCMVWMWRFRQKALPPELPLVHTLFSPSRL